MSQWLAFDEEAAACAAIHTNSPVVFQGGDALSAAVASSRDAVIMLASDHHGQVTLLSIRHLTPTPRKPIALEATGILGLTDAVVLNEEQEPRQKEHWWKKLAGKKE